MQIDRIQVCNTKCRLSLFRNGNYNKKGCQSMDALDLYLNLETQPRYEGEIIAHTSLPPMGDLLTNLLILNKLKKKLVEK